jgi:hypothetical protein
MSPWVLCGSAAFLVGGSAVAARFVEGTTDMGNQLQSMVPGIPHGVMVLAGLALLSAGMAITPRLRQSLLLALIAWALMAGNAHIKWACVSISPEDRVPMTQASLSQWETTTRYHGTTIRSEYLPIWAKGNPSVSPAGATRLALGRGTVSPVLRRANRAEFEVTSPAPDRLLYGAYYFPGWRATIDGAPAAVSPDETGMVSVDVPAGKHRVAIDFGSTPVRTAAGLVALLALAAGLLVARRYPWPRAGRA